MVLVGALLGGCGGGAGPLGEIAPTPDVPRLTAVQAEAAGTLALSHVLLAQRAVSGGYGDGLLCRGGGDPVVLHRNEDDYAGLLRESFTAVMGERFGFPLAGGDGDDVFRYGQGEGQAEYRLGARIRSLHLALCQTTTLMGAPAGADGWAEAEIVFQVQHQLDRRLVYDGTIRARAELDSPVRHAPADALIRRVFEDALVRLAADRAFRRALVSGLPRSDALRRADVGGRTAPPGWSRPVAWEGRSWSAPSPAHRLPPSPPSLSSGWEAGWPTGAAAGGPFRSAGGGGALTPASLTIPGPPLYTEPFALNVEAIRAATVTILGMSGHGSGFFLSRDGWLLTSQHVVDGADVFRVRLVDGREPWARVERRNPRRDVALLKVNGQGFSALPIRPTLAQVSETTYAVGTPSRRTLGQTVSQGIISAWRPAGPDGLPVYQATTPIHGGNSGGPLVDAWGNVIGVAVSMISDRPGALGVGLGFFIPIHDALTHLGVRVVPAAPVTALPSVPGGWGGYAPAAVPGALPGALPGYGVPHAAAAPGAWGSPPAPTVPMAPMAPMAPAGW